MYAILTPQWWERVPSYNAYTYEEHNERIPVVIGAQLPPEVPRDAYSGPNTRKPAAQQVAMFYDHGQPNLGARSGPAFLGWHTVVAADGGSWTASPRGVLRAFGKRRPIARRDPSSFSDEVPEIYGR